MNKVVVLTFLIMLIVSFQDCSLMTSVSRGPASVASVKAAGAGSPSFSVDSYGASADGSTDSTAAFANAIQAAQTFAAQSGQQASVVMSAGTYRLDCANAPYQGSVWVNVCFPIVSATNLTIIGQGIDSTKLLLTNPRTVLTYVYASKNFTLNSFSIDYAKSPFTQGTILGVQQNQFIDVQLQAGYPDLSDPSFSPASDLIGILYEASAPILKGDIKNSEALSRVVSLGGGAWRIYLTSTANMQAGDRYGISIRIPVSGLTFNGCENVNINQVRLLGAAGTATAWFYNKGAINITGMQVKRKSDSLISTAADAFHMQNNLAQVRIEYCEIEGQGDDAINFYSTGFSISSALSSSHIQLQSATLFPFFAIGQTLQVIDKGSQYPKGSGKIVSLTQLGNNVIDIVLDQNIPNLLTGDTFFNFELAAPNAIVRNNTFGSFRGIFRLRSNGGLFYGNSILDARNAVAYETADVPGNEGPSLLQNAYGVYIDSNSVPGGNVRVQGVNYADLGLPTQTGTQALLAHPLVFDPTFYRLVNSDLSGMNDAQITSHWQNNGMNEGRYAKFSFHPADYLVLNSDLAAAYGAQGYVNAAVHYVTNGGPLEHRLATIAGSPLVFNVNQYRSLNPDLISYSDLGLQAHWLTHGIDEARQAHIYFKGNEYLILNQDVQNQQGAGNYRGGINHYVQYGKKEGRLGAIYSHPKVYSWISYRDLNSDLAALGWNEEQLGLHWLTHGMQEGRTASADFSAVAYLQKYPDIGAAYGSTNYPGGIYHYVVYGILEGRTSHAAPTTCSITINGQTSSVNLAYGENMSAVVTLVGASVNSPRAYWAGAEIAANDFEFPFANGLSDATYSAYNMTGTPTTGARGAVVLDASNNVVCRTNIVTTIAQPARTSCSLSINGQTGSVNLPYGTTIGGLVTISGAAVVGAHAYWEGEGISADSQLYPFAGGLSDAQYVAYNTGGSPTVGTRSAMVKDAYGNIVCETNTVVTTALPYGY